MNEIKEKGWIRIILNTDKKNVNNSLAQGKIYY